MSFPFHQYPLLVVAWHQEGCPACSDYLPRFRQVAEHYKSCVQSAILDANQFSDQADRLWVRGTPITMILRGGRRSPYVLDGAVETPRIEALYQTVLRGMTIGGAACEIG
jgi:thioredoxin-like negative regulator of GroEL